MLDHPLALWRRAWPIATVVAAVLVDTLWVSLLVYALIKLVSLYV
jgi:hypothetical protein